MWPLTTHPRACRGSTFSIFKNKKRVGGWDRKEKVIVLQHGPNAQTLQRAQAATLGIYKGKPGGNTRTLHKAQSATLGSRQGAPADTSAHCNEPNRHPQEL